ncbi:arylsulfatase B [Limnoglobus roseus]|uniref:Arylsulfatase n=1 Tax=Limnoglobus roseus TaxID=2598579 RepID=A0A5C1APR2_9BACT|nr:arylsulfatase [Limnoglobus roseus]QEL20147.1 arylsulfatase [Limnoglobus roseus]
MFRFFALLALATFATAAGAAEKPNIVVILADDLGRADCGFMGGKDIPTPNIDKLAKAGATLDAFYVQPVCSPTRAAFMTGRYPMRHGLQVGVVRPWAQYGLPLEEQTIAQGLKSAGYTTAICGKWHLGHFQPEYLPTKRGFDHQYGHYNGALDYFTHIRDGGFDWHRDDAVCRDEGYSTHLIAKEAAKFVADTAGKSPFFLYVPFNAVHAPLEAPDEYLNRFPNLKNQRKKYAAMLSAMDDGVGTILAALDKAGATSNTLVIFSSDNGGPSPGTVTDNGPYRAGKGTLYEGGVRVAACAAWPGHIPVGTTNREPMHMVDLYPTFLKIAGATVSQKLPLDGLDVGPTLTAGKPSPHESILLNTTPSNGAVRAGDWKLVVKTAADDPDGEGDAGKPLAKPSVELFDLKADPYEKTNLAGKEAEKVAALRKTLDGYAKQAVTPKAKPKAKDFVTPKVWGEKS